MGAWGTGIFENDSALDFLGDIERSMIDRIRVDLDTLDNGYLDRVTPATISILLAMAHHIPPTRLHLDPAELKEFRQRYLQWFDANAHEYGGEDAVLNEMRAKAASEFDALIALCSERPRK